MNAPNEIPEAAAKRLVEASAMVGLETSGFRMLATSFGQSVSAVSPMPAHYSAVSPVVGGGRVNPELWSKLRSCCAMFKFTGGLLRGRIEIAHFAAADGGRVLFWIEKYGRERRIRQLVTTMDGKADGMDRVEEFFVEGAQEAAWEAQVS